MSDLSAAVSHLQSQWHHLHDLDRARAVDAIHQAGASLRELAKALNCSPSLLRHLLTALQAPIEDRHLARRGGISTRELARRAKAAGTRRTAKHREALALERAQASLQGCRNICDWLVKEGIPGSYGEQIVAEARRQIALTELGGKFPKHPAPPDMPVQQIIQRCRPSEAAIHELTSVAWFGTWLALWAYYAFTDSWVRDKAIDLALEQQTKR